MEKMQNNRLENNIGYLFIGIWICVLIGFHKTYTIHFPAFEGFIWQQHLHGAVLMSWLVLLMIQPFLIRSNKRQLHRKIGKLGYVLAPMVCYSIFMVSKMVYYRETAHRPEASVLGQLALDIPTIFIFGLFFALAMINRKNAATHMRYMIATSLLLIGPGLGRALIIFGRLSFPDSVSIVYYVSEIIAVSFLVIDIWKRANYKPFLTITIFLLINHVCWAFQQAGWWQTIAKWFVTATF